MQDWKSLPFGLREICNIDSLSSSGIPAEKNQKNAEGFIWRVNHTIVTDDESTIRTLSVDFNKFSEWLIELTAKSNYVQKSMSSDKYRSWVRSCPNKAVQYILYLASNDINQANSLYPEYLNAMKCAIIRDAESFDDRKCHIVKDIFSFDKPQNVLQLGNIWMTSEMPYNNFFGYVQPKVQVTLDSNKDFSEDLAKRTRFNNLEKGVYYKLVQYYYGLFSKKLSSNERAIILLYALRSNPDLAWAYLEIFEHFPDDAKEYQTLAQKYAPTLTKQYFEERQKIKKCIADAGPLVSSQAIEELLNTLDYYKRTNCNYSPVNEINQATQRMQQVLSKEVELCNSTGNIPDSQIGLLAVKYKSLVINEIGSDAYNSFIDLLNQRKAEQLVQNKISNIQISYQRAKEYVSKINAAGDLDIEKASKMLTSESVYLLAASETKKSTQTGYKYDLVLKALNGNVVPIESPTYQKLLSEFSNPNEFLIDYNNIPESNLLAQIATMKKPVIEPEEPQKEIKRVSESVKKVGSIVSAVFTSILLFSFIPKSIILIPIAIISAFLNDDHLDSSTKTLKFVLIGVYTIVIPITMFFNIEWLTSSSHSWVVWLLVSIGIIVISDQFNRHGLLNNVVSCICWLTGGLLLSISFFIIVCKICNFVHLYSVSIPVAFIISIIVYIGGAYDSIKFYINRCKEFK